MTTVTDRELFRIPNVRLFIYFRLFFNARFYYPIFTILFLDFGLTLEQFALLNVVWAATIVLLEVPSGALADTMGRRNLLVLAAVLMMLEMLLLCFAPRGNPSLLFTFFLANRIFSGTAEAAASGADEALAFDTLQELGLAGNWNRVLDRQMRVQSMGYIAAMSIGAAVYDPRLMHTVAGWLGWYFTPDQSVTLRFPIYLTLGIAVLALLTTLRMREVGPAARAREAECSKMTACGQSVGQAFRLTFQAGAWIFQTPMALVLITAGVLFDNIIRMVLTLSSQYYRLIQLPEASFGLIGSALALLGVFLPRLASKLVTHRRPGFNMVILSVLTLAGLAGMTFFWPVAGLAPMVLLYSAMLMAAFMLSYYLNRITESRHRATVLSFKGLFFNLAYGLAGLLYSLLIAALKSDLIASRPELAGDLVRNAVFIQSIAWFPWYFLLTLVLWFLLSRWQLRGGGSHFPAPH
jgi:MFS family permease